MAISITRRQTLNLSYLLMKKLFHLIRFRTALLLVSPICFLNGLSAQPYNWMLEIEGVASGFFVEVSGIGSENEIVEYKVVNSSGVEVILKVPGRLNYANITLKRGITSNMDMWTWRKMVEDGNIEGARSNMTLMMLDSDGSTVAQWDFANAWPVKISFDSEFAFESITIAHEGLTRIE
mgnify:CR=1 FL=1